MIIRQLNEKKNKQTIICAVVVSITLHSKQEEYSNHEISIQKIPYVLVVWPTTHSYYCNQKHGRILCI